MSSFKPPSTFISDQKSSQSVFIPSFLSKNLSSRFRQPSKQPISTLIKSSSPNKPQELIGKSTSIRSFTKNSKKSLLNKNSINEQTLQNKNQQNRQNTFKVQNTQQSLNTQQSINKGNKFIAGLIGRSFTNLPMFRDSDKDPSHKRESGQDKEKIRSQLDIQNENEEEDNDEQVTLTKNSKWNKIKSAINVQSALKSFLKGNEKMGLSGDGKTFYRYSYLHSRQKIKNSKEVNILIMKSKEASQQIIAENIAKKQKIESQNTAEARRDSRMKSLNTFHFKSNLKSKDHGVIPFSRGLTSLKTGALEQELEHITESPHHQRQDQTEISNKNSDQNNNLPKNQTKNNQIDQKKLNFGKQISKKKSTEEDSHQSGKPQNAISKQATFLNIDQIAALEIIKKQMLSQNLESQNSPTLKPAFQHKRTFRTQTTSGVNHHTRSKSEIPLLGVGINNKQSNQLDFQPKQAQDVLDLFAPQFKRPRKNSQEDEDEFELKHHQDKKQQKEIKEDQLLISPSQHQQPQKLQFNLQQKPNQFNIKSFRANNTIKEEEISSSEQSFEDYMNGPSKNKKNKRKKLGFSQLSQSQNQKGKKTRNGKSLSKFQISQINPISMREQDLRENLKQTTNFLSNTQQSYDIRNLMIRDHLILTIDKMQKIRPKIKEQNLFDELQSVITESVVVCLNKYLEKIIFKILKVSEAIVCKPIYQRLEHTGVMACPVKFGPKGVQKKLYYDKYRLNDNERLIINSDLYSKMLDFISNCSTIFFFYSKKKLNYIHMPKDITEIVFQCDQLRFNVGLVGEEIRGLEKALEEKNTKGVQQIKKSQIVKDIIKQSNTANPEDRTQTLYLVSQLKKLQKQKQFGTNEVIAQTRESKIELNKHISLHLREYSSWKKKTTDPDKYQYKNLPQFKDCTMQLEDYIDKMRSLEKRAGRTDKEEHYLEIKKLINEDNFSLQKNLPSCAYLKY